MIREPSESALERAARRLDQALGRLEQKVAGGMTGAGGASLFDRDRAELAAALDQARARERQLEEAAAAASDALGRAIAEIRSALGASPEPEPAGE